MNEYDLKDAGIINTTNVPRNCVIDEINSENKGTIDFKIPENENSLDDVLSELKLTGPYHIKFLIIMSLILLFNAVSPINYVFAAKEIGYRCKHADCTYSELYILQQNSTLSLQCVKFNLFDDNNTCTPDNFDESRYTKCSEWVYEEPNSFVAEFDLACEDWKRTLVGTMHSIGFMIGLLFIGPLADKYGRKKILIITTFLVGIIGISKSMVKSYWIYITLEILEPLLGDNFSTIYTMLAEMITTKKRPIMVILPTICYSSGAIYSSLLAYLTPNWRIYLISLYSPPLIFILCTFFLDESPRWLLTKGRKSEADRIIKKAAKINNIVINEFKIINMRTEDNSSLNLKESLKITFSSGKLIFRFLLCCCVWFTTLYNAYSLMINAVSLEGNAYLNFGLVALSDVAGGIITAYVLGRFGRKTPLITTLMLTGVCCILQSFVPKDYRWLAVLLYICGEINACIALGTVYLYTIELFPTYTRNTMLALCSSIGRFGAILAPLTPLLIKYWVGLPLFLVGVLALLTASLVTLMPDTSKDALPDNVKQAEVVGIKENRRINPVQ